MTETETKEEMLQPEHVEQQEIVEQPVVVVQPVKNIPVKEKKTMLSLDDRMKEFRDMMLERGVGHHSCTQNFPSHTPLGAMPSRTTQPDLY